MAISWGTIRSLALFLGPLLLPRAIAYYRSVRAAPRQHGLSIRPLPAHISRALLVLFAAAVFALAQSLPWLAPENVFRTTQSRLQIPTDVLFTRLASLRADGALTPRDEALRAKFVNLESRLLYLQLGPAVLADCPFCAADEPRAYLYYALPALAVPHLVNLVVIAAVTSAYLFGGPRNSGGSVRPQQRAETAQWRTAGTIAAVALLLLDVYLVTQYNYQANSLATRLGDIDFFFWSMRSYRYVALATLDGLLGWAIWLTGTNRAFVSPPSPAERVEAVTRALANTKSGLNAVGILQNAVVRDEELRARSQAYWAHEVMLMREVMEEREVIEGISDALEKRVNIDLISRDADMYAKNILPSQQSTAGSGA